MLIAAHPLLRSPLALRAAPVAMAAPPELNWADYGVEGHHPFSTDPSAALSVTGHLLDGLALYLVFAFAWHVLRPKLARMAKPARPADAALDEATFGWLQADMRVPLPPLAELKSACHLLGVEKGRQVFLCAEPENFGGGCARSGDFSEYYGEPVYVCRPAMSAEGA